MRRMRFSIALILCAVIVLSVSATAFASTEGIDPGYLTGRVISSDAKLESLPGWSGSNRQLSVGNTFIITGSSGAWYAVTMTSGSYSGYSGWIYIGYVAVD